MVKAALVGLVLSVVSAAFAHLLTSVDLFRLIVQRAQRRPLTPGTFLNKKAWACGAAQLGLLLFALGVAIYEILWGSL
jgi:hypothetical protein